MVFISVSCIENQQTAVEVAPTLILMPFHVPLAVPARDVPRSTEMFCSPWGPQAPAYLTSHNSQTLSQCPSVVFRSHQITRSRLAVPIGNLATPLSLRWDNMRLKHSWDAVPENGMLLDYLPTSTTVNLNVALQPRQVSASIDTLDEVSDFRHPKHVLTTTGSLTYVFTRTRHVPWTGVHHIGYSAQLSKEQVASH